MQRLRRATERLDVEFAPTTVTLREQGKALPDPTAIAETGVYSESRYDTGAVYASPVYETVILDETPLGMSVLADDPALALFDAILAIIGSGSFPKPKYRENLSEGERRQLRDAMILEAHAREGRDVLVSNDEKAFIGKDGKRRAMLEAICRTKIRTVDEFLDQLRRLVSGDA
jgi:hypothetical protein